MGIFNSIGKALFGDPTKGIRNASNDQLAFQQQGLDYAKEFNQPLIDARNRMLPQLEGFYGGDADTQNQFIDTVQSNPLYNTMVENAQSGIVGKNQALGLSRSGNTGVDIGNSNTNILNSLIQQRLGGMQGLANMPINAGAVTNQYGAMGENVGGAGMGIVNANQQLAGQGFQALMSGVQAGAGMSDERLKENIKLTGQESGHNTYSWSWNDKAKEEFGLSGQGFGAIAQEVEKTNPESVVYFNGYRAIKYDEIGVKHG